MITRLISPHLLKSLSFFPALGIVGPRQVGKTTLSKQIQADLQKQTLYLDLELDSDRFRLSRAEWFLEQHLDKCVIIDEIQRMPELFPLLRALIDRKREPTRFILLGSASPDLLRHSSESLAGRIHYSELMPFSYPEVRHQMTMTDHWLRGGFPDACLAPQLEFTWQWQQQFIQSFIERDLRSMGIDVNPVLFNRLLRMLGHIHGEQQNISTLSNSLGISASTVNRYLDLLEGSFLITRLQPWFTNVGKRLTKSPKIYIRDSGLLHQLLLVRDFDQLQGNPKIGISWEGYVIEEIRRALAGRGQLYYYRTQSGAEVDVLLEMADGKKICIEIKYALEPVPSRGFYQSVEDIQPEAQFILVPYGNTWAYSDKIKISGLENFLENELPKFIPEKLH
ncbi:MAG: ATP-binding protein [Bacteroidia bacterium]|nr:ATP-binding protein [Bacteroidia bacterium]